MISTWYRVIGEPPFEGATQLISTLVPEIVVVGGSGLAGGPALPESPSPLVQLTSGSSFYAFTNSVKLIWPSPSTSASLINASISSAL